MTLTNMATGGMYDQEMGGFFRYATTKDWTIPQYEKLLKDNAKLLRVYLQAYQAFGRDIYEQTARKTLDYLDSFLYDQTRGIFFGSQAADEQYYNLALEERLGVATLSSIAPLLQLHAMAIVSISKTASVLHSHATRARLPVPWIFCGVMHTSLAGDVSRLRGAALAPVATDQVWMGRALLHSTSICPVPISAQAETLMKSGLSVSTRIRRKGYFDCW